MRALRAPVSVATCVLGAILALLARPAVACSRLLCKLASSAARLRPLRHASSSSMAAVRVGAARDPYWFISEGGGLFLVQPPPERLTILETVLLAANRLRESLRTSLLARQMRKLRSPRVERWCVFQWHRQRVGPDGVHWSFRGLFVSLLACFRCCIDRQLYIPLLLAGLVFVLVITVSISASCGCFIHP